MARKPRVVCIGDCCVDVYLPPVGRSFLGGNAVNTAVAVRQAGLPVSYVGAPGDDRAGQILLKRLKALGINTTYAHACQAPTNRSHVRLLAGGRLEFLHELNPPRLPLTLTTAALSYILRQPWVHANWLWPHFADIAGFRLTPGLNLSVDYGHNPPRELLDRALPFVRVAFFALPAERAGEAPGLAEQIFARGPRLVVVTLGEGGSLAYDGQLYRQPAIPTNVVDSLGAGDAFIGTFLGQHLTGRGLADCLYQASLAASRACSFYGAWEGAELDEEEAAS